MADDKSRLSDAVVKAFLKAHAGWKLKEGELRKTYEFKSFTEAIAFVTRIADAAEKADHHPDIDIRYKRVTLALVTYDADGLTARDPKFAEVADSLEKA